MIRLARARFVVRAPARATQYQAELRGPAWPLGGGPIARFDSVAECGRWARRCTIAGADTCDVTLANGWIVARYTRGPDTGGAWRRVRD